MDLLEASELWFKSAQSILTKGLTVPCPRVAAVSSRLPLSMLSCDSQRVGRHNILEGSIACKSWLQNDYWPELASNAETIVSAPASKCTRRHQQTLHPERPHCSPLALPRLRQYAYSTHLSRPFTYASTVMFAEVRL